MNEIYFQEIVDEILKLKKENLIHVKTICIKDKDTIFKNNFTDEVNPTNIRSITKTILSMLTGIAIDLYEDFDENTNIYPLIKKNFNIENKLNIEKLKKIKIRHLLNHTTGFEDLVLKSSELEDINEDKVYDYIINYPLKYNPGDYFNYSNAGFLLLSYYLEKIVACKLYDFANKNLFYKLDIINPRWDTINGFVNGATNLYLKSDDLLKIGLLILNRGKYNNKQIVSESWIDKISTTSVCNFIKSSNQYLNISEYGYGIWTYKDILSYASGTNGQEIVVIPSKDMIIAVNSENINSEVSIKKILDKIIIKELA